MYFCVGTISMISVGVALLSLCDFMHKEDFVLKKSLIYVVFFTVILTPVILILVAKYEFIINSVAHLDFRNAEEIFLYMDIFLIAGTTVYTLRIPERFIPNRFDYWVNYPYILVWFTPNLAHFRCFMFHS